MRQILITLAFTFIGFAAAAEEISGPWKVMISSDADAKFDEQLVVFKQSGDALYVKDAKTKNEFRGSVDGKTITFLGKTKIDATGESIDAEFKGKVTGTTASGVVHAGGEELKWEASRLPALWQCSNHKPADLAASEEEMRGLTSNKGCEGWHQGNQ
jgi:hypothetical protein